jgi:hypothetical protein
MLNQLLLELRARDGSDIVTYGLVVSLIALVGVVGVMLLGSSGLALDAGEAVGLLSVVGS